MNTLQNKRILITGVGVKPIGHIFRDVITGMPSHTPVTVDGQTWKANIGAATAYACAKAGAIVHLVARSEDKLHIVKQWIEQEVPNARVEYTPVDLNDNVAIGHMIQSLPADAPLYWVQSVGLGAGTVKLKDDNPYVPMENIPPELIEAELSVLKNTFSLFQQLLPRFRRQPETRVCIISSMSAVRGYGLGTIHCSAKGAISRFANAAMIEYMPEHIYVTDVRPGAVDTGMYDVVAVQDAVANIAARYGTDWSHRTGGLRLAPPSSVGQAIVGVLESDAHITSLNLVARGQWPHEGS